MTPRDIVRRTLAFDGPERVARSFAGSDFVSAGHGVRTLATGWQRIDERRWQRTDEWGNTWARVDPTSKGEVTRGVLDDLDAAEDYEFPDFSDPADFARVSEVRAAHPDEWLIGGLPGFAFNIARKLRRLDNYLSDLLLEPTRTHELHDRIDALLEDMIRNYAGAGVDSVMFPEDWGTQARLLVHPELWRQEFGPRFERLCRLAHDHGVSVFMHSCGQIAAIVPDLIDAGIDLLQLDQPELHGIDVLAGYQEDRRITFWCPVDIQTTLQTQDEEAIRRTARHMLDRLWRQRGGFIAGFYGDDDSIGLEPRWQEIACDEFLRAGVRGRC
jgi:hypothetical protein